MVGIEFADVGFQGPLDGGNIHGQLGDFFAQGVHMRIDALELDNLFDFWKHALVILSRQLCKE
jgi:hypothetical protein